MGIDSFSDDRFDKVIPRYDSGSYKWDTPHSKSILPMWVADMDFPVAPCIQKALERRVAHGIFGYTLVQPSYYRAVVNWFRRRYRWNIRRESILYTTGVVPAVSCCIKAMCMEGENVLVQTPVFNCFFSSIRNQGCQIVENELVRKDNTYCIDFDDFEKKCSDDRTTVFLLCNPHNPVGRVWTRGELEKMNEICLRHNVRVIADEIHCEIVMPEYKYTPFASISKAAANNCVALSSPSKAFNTAGLQIANIVCDDSELRRRIDRAVNIFEVCDVNPFGPVALEAAYSAEGAEWLEKLNGRISESYMILKMFLALNLPKIKLVKLEGTYLAWLDIRELGLTADEAYRLLLEKGKLMLGRGTDYGVRAGEGYLRMNLACPSQLLEEGLRRLNKAFQGL